LLQRHLRDELLVETQKRVLFPLFAENSSMTVLELAPGLWRWTAPHPDWKAGDDWEQEVGCVYYEAPAATVLIDPLVPPERDRFFEALDRDVERRGLPVAVLLTVPWHERSAAELVERYAAADEPCGRVEPFAVPEVDETLWWLPEHAALVAGDVLVGTPEGIGVCPDSWLDERSSHDSIRAALQPLLERPVERILVSHGEPVLADGRAALARALG
jgi:glyoxylase-like metal-dependent hydrolase (beta-lactamase superfamily II)